MISKRDFVAKIVAAKNAKKNDDFIIIGRVEALIADLGIEEAMSRANAYAKAGADIIFVHSRKESTDEIFEFLKLWQGKVPIMIIPTAFPTVTLDELKSRGVGMVVYAHQTTLAAFAAVSDVIKQMSKVKSLSELNTKMASMEDLFNLQGMQQIRDHESFVEEEVKKLGLS
jgi:phosphoenolpyruvate phosphomutase